MPVIAKFKVNQVASSNNADEYFNISLAAVTEGSAENKEFFKWTPEGQINLSTVNPKAAEQFKEGAEIYVYFSESPVATTYTVDGSNFTSKEEAQFFIDNNGVVGTKETLGLSGEQVSEQVN